MKRTSHCILSRLYLVTYLCTKWNGGVESLEDVTAHVWNMDALTAVFFETGAMPVPTKLQNPTICGSGDPFHL